MHRSTSVWPALLGLLVSLPVLAQTPWTTPKGQWVLTPATTYEFADQFYLGETKSDLPDTLVGQNLLLLVEYGVSDNASVDLVTGFAQGSFDQAAAFGPNADNEITGMSDTRIGFRYRLINEFDGSGSTPTVTVRVGAILAGTYDEAFINSPGDGANAVEASVHVGKLFADNKMGVFGHVGYRYREGDVPNDLYYRIAYFAQLSEVVSLSVGYMANLGQDGGDIGAPGFRFSPNTPGTGPLFPTVKEEEHMLETYLSFRDGPRQFSVGFAKTIEGRNTPVKNVISLGMSWEF